MYSNNNNNNNNNNTYTNHNIIINNNNTHNNCRAGSRARPAAMHAGARLRIGCFRHIATIVIIAANTTAR